MQEMVEIIKSNWVSSCIIKIGQLNLTDVFWIMCMTGVLILEWPNLTDEEWHLGRRVICFTAKSFFFLPALWFRATRWWIPESKLWICIGWKEREVSRSQITMGMTRKFWAKSRLQARKKSNRKEKDFTSSKWARRWQQRVINVTSYKTSSRSEKGEGGIAQCRGRCVCVCVCCVPWKTALRMWA